MASSPSVTFSAQVDGHQQLPTFLAKEWQKVADERRIVNRSAGGHAVKAIP
jgi:hypothetical protein